MIRNRKKKCFFTRMRNHAFRIAAVCLAVLSLAGCAAEKTEVAPVSVPTAEPEPSPVSGGELRLYMPQNPDLSDPLAVNTEEMQLMFSLVFEGLVQCDEQNQIVPCLAENWTADETGRVWTFHLRSSVTWQNSGTAFTANDVAYTLSRILNSDGGYYVYVKNAVESYEVTDKSTIVITMREAGITQLYNLLFPVLCEADEGAELPVGTGAYCFTDYDTREEAVTLTANENWWRESPYITKIVFETRSDNEKALASYAAGQLDFVPTSSLNAGRYREEGVTTVTDVMTQQAEFLFVNHSSSVLSDVRVRRALAYGINRSELVTNIYMNRAVPADVPIAPDSFAYESKSKVYDYDLTSAKALLSEAGWEDTDSDGILESTSDSSRELSLTLLVNETADVNARRSAANLIASQLLKLGIDVTVETETYSLSETDSDYVKRLESGEFDLALAGFHLSRSTDVRPFLSKDGKYNYGGCYDSELYELLTKMVFASDEKTYREAASAFQQAFAAKLPFIVLYFRCNSVVASEKIKGITTLREPDLLRNIASWYFNEE